MLAPHELKNKAFSKAVRGYNPSEVDDHIEFLIEKYTELYRENAELNRKLGVVVTKLDEIQEEEASIRSTLVSAQKMGEKIIKDATDKADLITDSIKERCEAVIADFKRRMVLEKEELWKLRTGVLDFKQDLFELYRKHIEEIQGISVNSIEEIILPDENTIVEGILGDVAEAVKSDNVATREEEAQADLNPTVPAEDETVVIPPAPTEPVDDDFFIKSLEESKAGDKK